MNVWTTVFIAILAGVIGFCFGDYAGYRTGVSIAVSSVSSSKAVICYTTDQENPAANSSGPCVKGEK